MFGEPKEDIFYTLFKEFGAKIVETAEEYNHSRWVSRNGGSYPTDEGL